jgi:hypothetical protein
VALCGRIELGALAVGDVPHDAEQPVTVGADDACFVEPPLVMLLEAVLQ